MVIDSETGQPWWIAVLVSVGICSLVIGTSLLVSYLATHGLDAQSFLPYPGN